MMNPLLRFRYIRPEQDRDIPLPRYMTPGSAGMDICAAMIEAADLAPGGVVLIPTGFALAIPEGYEVQIRPRSGLSVRHTIGIINAPGTIDADYRGEVMVPLINFGNAVYTVHRGDRIAQMVVHSVCRARLEVVDWLDDTDRGPGGFGHTGYR